MRALLPWYDVHKRDLPWRRTRDPYAIWVSEAMCQQTQIGTVLPYYERWMERFPTAGSLASASLDEVLSLWQGLGYYRRARALHSGASLPFPTTFEGWLGMPGVGRYTAAAIASICFGEAVAVVDGNVERVFARFMGSETVGPRRTKAAFEWANGVLCSERPGDSNQALMELGATVCKPRQPLCASCPLQDGCAAFREGLQGTLPVASPRVVPEAISQSCLIPVHLGKIGFLRAAAGEWWSDLYRFPDGTSPYPLGLVKFAVTKHRVTLQAFLHESELEGVEWFTPDEARALPLPAPYRRLLESFLAANAPTGGLMEFASEP